MNATTDDVRAYAGLPDEVPETLLVRHLLLALRDLQFDSGVTTSPIGVEEDWKEAHIVRALSSAFPYLHTFTLSGAAKAGRLISGDAAIEFRFQTPEEVTATQARLESRYTLLLSRITSSDGQADVDITAGGPMWMGAI